jgi:hypothetical protein
MVLMLNYWRCVNVKVVIKLKKDLRGVQVVNQNTTVQKNVKRKIGKNTSKIVIKSKKKNSFYFCTLFFLFNIFL